MKKQDLQGDRNPVPALPRFLFYGFAAALLAFFPRLSHGQCPNPLSVTGSTSAGATGTWTAPSSGGPWLVEIVATGAGGGGNAGGTANTGGTGATVTGRFVVQNGQSLFAIAGGPGVAGTGDNGGGGGGGSGVVNRGNPSNCALS